MAISYPIDFPTNVSAARISLTAQTNHGRTMSAFSFNQSVQKNDGTMWGLEVSLPPMKREDAEQWIAFLLTLNGVYGTFWYQIPTWKTPRGTPSGTPVLAGIAADSHIRNVGQSLKTTGWTPSTFSVLKKGDMIQIGNRLFKVLLDVDADGTGAATIEVWPKQLSDLADGTSIITSNAKGLFRLAQGDFTLCNIDEAGICSMSFSAIEAI